MTTTEGDDTAARLAGLADWTPWMILDEAVEDAPKLPGVFLARRGKDGPIIHLEDIVDETKGLRARFSNYAGRKGMTYGLGLLVINDALNDPAFLRKQLGKVEAGGYRRLHDWSRAAFDHQRIMVCWATTRSGAAAEELAVRCREVLPDHDLWHP